MASNCQWRSNVDWDIVYVVKVCFLGGFIYYKGMHNKNAQIFLGNMVADTVLNLIDKIICFPNNSNKIFSLLIPDEFIIHVNISLASKRSINSNLITWTEVWSWMILCLQRILNDRCVVIKNKNKMKFTLITNHLAPRNGVWFEDPSLLLC